VHLTRNTIATVAAAAAAVTMAACSSSGSTTAAGTSAGGSSTSSAGGSGNAEASAFLQKAEATPTGIGYSTPISKKAPTNIKVVVLEANVPIAHRIDQERAAAAKALGWSYSSILVGNGPEDAAKAMSQALDQKPNFIFEAGYNMSAYGDQIARAQSMGVKIIAQCITDDPSGPLIAVDCDKTSTDLMAKASAAYIASHGTGHDDIQLMDTSSFPIDAYYNKQLTAHLKAWCSGCKVSTIEFQLSDLGTKLPGMVVSAIQRDPKTDYLVAPFGDAMTGVEPALQAAGVSGSLKIGGYLPGVAQYKALRDKTNAFWVMDQTPIAGWREMDIAVRAAVGDPITTVTDSAPVSQLFTPDNISTAVFDQQGFWLGTHNFADDYKKLWLLNS
jgi:ribose transport system substrate-binding protein